MDLLGPLAAACPQMYYQGQPVAPASAPAHKAQDLVSSDEPIFQPWPQGYCLSAAEVAAILVGQNMHVPVQQQQPASLPARAFLGLCNEVTGPAITGQRTCAWGSGLGQYCPGGGGADHHHQIGFGKNTTTTAPNTLAREVAHEDATKLGLLQCCFGDSPAVGAASVAATSPLAATPDAAVTVASVAATTAGLAGLPASTAAPNGVVASYDLLQLQGLAADGALGVGAVTTTTTGAAAPAAIAAAAHAQQQEGGVAALCVTDTATGKSVAHAVAAARLDVRAQFGEAAVLFRCAGERGLDIEQVPVDASGRTIQPLQHGAFYYVLV
ncbi:WUSCHEL-related homeobox 7 [Panicum miliaceum]|uniref:WUSCHEL-related homeobox 7 n=1 Tax=Panicum miliaceum TaxID=4540 RepID=A0A3L6STE8_PANMI|nr:WUSCHEL-related homeobox 7 [Panicum miliaceum]